LRAAGRPVDLEETQREMEERDRRDSERDLAPLRQAEDALAIDSSSLDADAVAERVIDEIRKRALGN
jgi:cytidylate kinase